MTCLFDLERRERVGRRGIEFYRRHAALTLGLQAPMLLYVDPELADWVRSERERLGLSAITRVVPRTLEELPCTV